MTFDTRVITKSKVEHTCSLCLRTISKGSPYISAPHKDDNSGELSTLKLCPECAYIVKVAERNNFRHGNFTEQNIPNCLRKIRNKYRENPAEAWDELERSQNE